MGRFECSHEISPPENPASEKEHSIPGARNLGESDLRPTEHERNS